MSRGEKKYNSEPFTDPHTSLERNITDTYFNSIGESDQSRELLTAAEEAALAERIQKGKVAKQAVDYQSEYEPLDANTQISLQELQIDGDEARRILAVKNVRLVASIAREYARKGKVSLNDLLQDGNEGLMNAVDSFDPEKGRFTTHATYHIRQKIIRAYNKIEKQVYIPEETRKAIKTMHRMRDTLFQQFGRSPTYAEIANLMGIEERVVHELFLTHSTVKSLQDPAYSEDNETEFGETLPDTTSEDPKDFERRYLIGKAIKQALASLTPDELKIIKLLYPLEGGKAMSEQDIATQFNVTEQYVKTVHTGALRRMRRDKSLKSHLDEG